ncbi:MAG: hypothetical protein LZ174_09885 [Thaumarchaeota archaeon]|jgi:hypothetical protein|nr:hypothetical protein [Candidatus Geocrenenecus arthurdayi]
MSKQFHKYLLNAASIRVSYEVVLSERLRSIQIGYMRIKEIHGLVKVEVIPISRDAALKILKGEGIAFKSEAPDKSKA